LVGAYQTGNGSTFTLVLASDDNHFIVALDLTHNPRPQILVYSTSGAREIIRMNFSERSSRVTGPNTRVPIGACWLFRRIAALSSNLIREPSPLRTPFLVRTTSAVRTWPFLTLPRGIASLTVTLITSPMRA